MTQLLSPLRPSADAGEARRAPRSRRRGLTKAKRIGVAFAIGFILFTCVVGWVALVQLDLDGRAAAAPVSTPWPDDSAKAFAAAFATTAWTFSPDTDAQDRRERDLRAMASASIDLSRLVAIPSGRSQRVLSAWPAGAVRTATGADITVAMLVSTGASTGIDYLAVPVARDARGGLVVSAYPAPVSPPRAGDAPEDSSTSLDEAEAASIEGPIGRFVAAYLRGGAVAPEFLAPGVSIVPLGHRYTGIHITGFDLDVGAGAVTASTRRVRVVVEAVDTSTGALITARYRITVALQSDGRWLVSALGSRSRS